MTFGGSAWDNVGIKGEKMINIEKKICLEEVTVVHRIVRELIEKNLTEDFKAEDKLNNQEFLAKFETEINEAVVRAFKSKGYHVYDEINSDEIVDFTDNLIFGRLKNKVGLKVNENSKKLFKVKHDQFHKGAKEELAECRLGYANPSASSVKSVIL